MSALTYKYSTDGTLKAHQLGIGGLFTYCLQTYRIIERVPDKDAYVIEQCSGQSAGNRYELPGPTLIQVFNGSEG